MTTKLDVLIRNAAAKVRSEGSLDDATAILSEFIHELADMDDYINVQVKNPEASKQAEETNKFLRDLEDRSSPVKAGPKGSETKEQAKERILQEFQWNNFTLIGVTNHLHRAGWALDEAIRIANELVEPAKLVVDLRSMEDVPLSGEHPQTIDVHVGAWAIVRGTNGKRIGWIDTYQTFGRFTYRNNLIRKQVSEPAETSEDASELPDYVMDAVEKITPYLIWTIGEESPGYHPTMPSAVNAFLTTFGLETERRRFNRRLQRVTSKPNKGAILANSPQPDITDDSDELITQADVDDFLNDMFHARRAQEVPVEQPPIAEGGDNNILFESLSDADFVRQVRKLLQKENVDQLTVQTLLGGALERIENLQQPN